MMKALVALFLLLLGQGASGETLLVHGEIIHTMAGDAIRDGYVLIKDGRIAAIGRSSDYEPDGTETDVSEIHRSSHRVIVDAQHLRRTGRPPSHTDHDRDELDRLKPHFSLQLRAIDAYNSRTNDLIEWVREIRRDHRSILAMHHEALVPGQTMVIKTTGESSR